MFDDEDDGESLCSWFSGDACPEDDAGPGLIVATLVGGIIGGAIYLATRNTDD